MQLLSKEYKKASGIKINGQNLTDEEVKQIKNMLVNFNRKRSHQGMPRLLFKVQNRKY